MIKTSPQLSQKLKEAGYAGELPASADEMLNQLPCCTKNEWFVISVNPLTKYWMIQWTNVESPVSGESLAEAAGKMWLYLKKDGLL